MRSVRKSSSPTTITRVRDTLPRGGKMGREGSAQRKGERELPVRDAAWGTLEGFTMKGSLWTHAEGVCTERLRDGPRQGSSATGHSRSRPVKRAVIGFSAET